jgi:hypothetical protein
MKHPDRVVRAFAELMKGGPATWQATESSLRSSYVAVAGWR